MERVRFGCSFWRKLGPKSVDLMRPLRWGPPPRPSTILMELQLSNSSWTKLKGEASNLFFGMLLKRLMLIDT